MVVFLFIARILMINAGKEVFGFNANSRVMM